MVYTRTLALDVSYQLRTRRPSVKFIICVQICLFVLFVKMAYESRPINNSLIQMHNRLRFPEDMSALYLQESKNYFYMLHRHSTSLPRCADLNPRPSTRYAILVEHTGDDHGYFMSTLKLGVRLNWYLTPIRHETDLILEMLRETSPLATDVDVMSALRAGYDQVCHSRAIDGGMYNRFVVFNMTKYESVMYLDSDIMPVNDISHFIVNGTYELQRTGKYMMWAHERRCDWFNAGVMLVLPDSGVFYQLMRIHEAQVQSGLVRLIDSYSGINGFLNGELLPSTNQKDQAILNHMFHPHKNMSLSMSDSYNVLLYEHTATSDIVLQYAHLIHFIHTKTWKSPWCHLKYNHGKICDMWWATPTVLVR